MFVQARNNPAPRLLRSRMSPMRRAPLLSALFFWSANSECRRRRTSRFGRPDRHGRSSRPDRCSEATATPNALGCGESPAAPASSSGTTTTRTGRPCLSPPVHPRERGHGTGRKPDRGDENGSCDRYCQARELPHEILLRFGDPSGVGRRRPQSAMHSTVPARNIRQGFSPSSRQAHASFCQRPAWK